METGTVANATSVKFVNLGEIVAGAGEVAQDRTSEMPQDRNSGAEAAVYGREMGRVIARLLPATQVRAGSNEVDWQGQKAVIKSCRRANTSFGIIAGMLDRITIALVAIEDDLGGYRVTPCRSIVSAPICATAVVERLTAG